MPKEPQKTFEQNMEAMSKMSPAQVQAQIKELDKICVCGKCMSEPGRRNSHFVQSGKAQRSKKIKAACAQHALSRRIWL